MSPNPTSDPLLQTYSWWLERQGDEKFLSRQLAVSLRVTWVHGVGVSTGWMTWGHHHRWLQSPVRLSPLALAGLPLSVQDTLSALALGDLRSGEQRPLQVMVLNQVGPWGLRADGGFR